MQPGIPGSALALPDGMATGLEDLGVEDLKLPRLTIDHEVGGFKDSLSNVAYPVLTAIPLGVVKQRVLWRPVIEENKDAVPLCKSTDHNTGYPTLTQPSAAENFPWQAAQWNPGDFPLNGEGRVTLPCASCRLKEWGSHPIDGKKTWCSEQLAVILLYGPEGSEPGMTALFTAQRSSINTTKTFLANLMRRQLPAFAVKTRITLLPQMRGKNKYFVPVFTETGQTDPSQWPVYSDSLSTIRAFITAPPRLKEDAQAAPNPTVLAQQNQMGYAAQPQVMQAQQFDNNTWAPGVMTAQPVPQQPQQPAQPVYAQPAPQVQQYAQPTVAPVQAVPQSAVQPVAPTGGTSRDDDDLPF